jgi:DNA segregation ATPase FtsK/SpoIIIE-like protein
MVGRSTATPAPGTDEALRRGAEIVLTSGKASPSVVAHKLKIGFDQACAILKRMETEGVVTGSADQLAAT